MFVYGHLPEYKSHADYVTIAAFIISLLPFVTSVIKTIYIQKPMF